MANFSAVFNQEDNEEEQIQTCTGTDTTILSLDDIVANVSSLPTHTPQAKKGKPNLPLKVEKAKVDQDCTPCWP